jgi:hypothetical protein
MQQDPKLSTACNEIYVERIKPNNICPPREGDQQLQNRLNVPVANNKIWGHLHFKDFCPFRVCPEKNNYTNRLNHAYSEIIYGYRNQIKSNQ